MLTELIMGAVLAIIQSLGYAGIFVLMLAESTVLPVPSELVLPFAGYITALGSFDFWLVLIVATLGSIAGATISYGVGKVIGQEALMRVGKYFLLNEHDLDIARKWFTKHGEKTIFICRFIPVVRHVISIPAGFAEMNFKKFVLYTTAGALLWNAFLIIVGMQLQKNWEIILQYTEVLDVLAIIAIVGLIVFLYYRHVKKAKGQKRKK